MKQNRKTTVLLLSILLSITMLRGEERTLYDPTTMGFVEPLKGERAFLPSGPRQHTILWDTTHGVHLQYIPSFKYSNMAAMLADSGFTVVMDGQGVNNIDLSVYDIIVINTACSWSTAYTAAEVNALVNWYDNGHQQVIHTSDQNWGDNSYMHYVDDSVFTCNVYKFLSTPGGILIMSENTNCPNQNIRPVVQAFNMDCGLSTLSPGDLYFSNFSAHPIYNNVSQVFYKAAGELSASAPAQEIGWTASNQGTVAEMNEAIGIELTEFTAFHFPDEIRLKWRTECEMGNASWRIEQKDKQDVWGMIALIPSMGNSPKGSAYTHSVNSADPGTVCYFRLGSVDYEGKVVWLSTIQVDPDLLGIPPNDLLVHNIPNPFSTSTTIHFCLSESCHAVLGIYHASGQLVDILVDEKLESGNHFVDFIAEQLPGGVYFCYLKTSKTIQTRKLLILR